MGERQGGRARMQHHRDVFGDLLVEPAQLLAQHLQRRQHGRGVLGVIGVVPGREVERLRLDPGHGRSLADA
jgi:hypothetical protein